MRPIKMSPEIMAELVKMFTQSIANGSVSTQISFTKSLSEVKKDSIEIRFTDEAYDKMMALVNHFSTEIAWHGLVNRIDATHFEIYDIMVYPQTVTGANVETDQAKYQMWLMDPDIHSDEEFSHIRMQGHSHVNMATSPSGVDLSNQERMLDTFSADDYFIFLIWNKREEFSARVYDMKANVMYDEKDIKMVCGNNRYGDFCAEAEKFLEKKTYPQYQTTLYGTSYVQAAKTSGTTGQVYGNGTINDPNGVLTYNNGAWYNDEGEVVKIISKEEKSEPEKEEKPTPMSKTYNNLLKNFYDDDPNDLGAYGNSSSYLYAGYNAGYND